MDLSGVVIYCPSGKEEGDEEEIQRVLSFKPDGSPGPAWPPAAECPTGREASECLVLPGDLPYSDTGHSGQGTRWGC